MNSTRPDLSIIIVSWNVRELLKDCLQSIYDTIQGLHFEVFVVDNASHDGSARMIAHQFPEVHLIANSKNVGFGAANNQALRLATGRYALLINPDTLVTAGAINRLVEFMEQHPQAGLIGPELVNQHGVLLFNWGRCSLRNFAEYWCERVVALVLGRTYILFQQPRRVNILTGACWLVRFEAMASIGFYDEGLFMYAEEPDVCTRMRDAGWAIWMLRDVVVTHYKKQSVRQRGWGWNLPHFFRSMARWVRKRWYTNRVCTNRNVTDA